MILKEQPSGTDIILNLYIRSHFLYALLVSKIWIA
jgi:hypothetical protein